MSRVDDMPEITWAQVIQRRAEYQTWIDARLTLDTSAKSVGQLLAEALKYARSI
jgi:hypothetical protein